MKTNMLKRIAILLIVALLAAEPALAQTSSKGEKDTEPAVIVEVKATPALAKPTASPPPFSIPGNGEVLDDIHYNNKEFYTVTTENNKTFFIVVDKSSTSNNVYMLAKVDENDVAEFIEGGLSTPAPVPTAQPTVIIQQPTPAPTAPVIETQPVEKDKDANLYTLIAIIAVAGLGGLVYFKVLKPKKDTGYDDSEGMEYDDSDDYEAEEE